MSKEIKPISANEAREAVVSVGMTNNMKEVYNKIRIMSNSGMRFCFSNATLREEDKAELKGLGYNVQPSPMGDTISW